MESEIKENISGDLLLNKLKCSICKSNLDDPIFEITNSHRFCKKCFDSILTKKGIETNPLCPICKSPIILTLQPKVNLNNESSMYIKCNATYENQTCDFNGNINEYYTHVKTCELYTKFEKNVMREITSKMIESLDKGINPHLKSKHLEIFEKYVKNWNWLVDTNQDWKWWWWMDNPWWENKPCQECNRLWHKYDDEIEVFEKQRIALLKSFI